MQIGCFLYILGVLCPAFSASCDEEDVNEVVNRIVAPLLTAEPWDPSSEQEFRNWSGKLMMDSDLYLLKLERVYDMISMDIEKADWLHVKQIVKFGSLHDGTVLDKASDIDVIIIVEDTELPSLIQSTNLREYVQQYESLANKWASFLTKLHYVNTAEYVKYVYVLKVHLVVDSLKIKVDLSFTSDVIDHSDLGDIYGRMLQVASLQRQEKLLFQKPILPLISSEDKKSPPPDFIHLRRLLKYWLANILNPVFQYCFNDRHHGITFSLLARYSWQRAGSLSEFDPLCGFQSTLETVVDDMMTMRHYWTEYYNASIAEEAIQILGKTGSDSPLLLTPLDPTSNTLHYRIQPNLYLDILIATARRTLASPLITFVEGTWKKCDWKKYTSEILQV